MEGILNAHGAYSTLQFARRQQTQNAKPTSKHSRVRTLQPSARLLTLKSFPTTTATEEIAVASKVLVKMV